MKTRLPAAALPLALLFLPLAACGGNDSDANDDRTAAGEVLEGTITDEMLPLDTTTSEPPLLKTETPKAGASSEAAARDEETADTAEAPEGESSTAAQPTPTTTSAPTPTATQGGAN